MPAATIDASHVELRLDSAGPSHASDDEIESVPELRPEDVVIGEPINEGGGSTVFRATLRGKPVALKRVKPRSHCKHTTYEEAVSELRSEAALLRRIRHPHIVRMHGTCLDVEQPWIALDLIEASNLWRVLHREERGFWSRREIVRVALHLADAMCYLHARNIVHRDLKSQNLVMDGNQNLILLDFGLAREEAPDGKMTPRTGSYRWAAPEVLRGDRYYRSCDVYSYGACMWEMITGELPHAGLEPMDNICEAVAHRNARLRPLAASLNCSASMAALVAECLSPDPAARPPFSAICARLVQMSAEAEAEGLASVVWSAACNNCSLS
eukprot:tig00020927_g15939.t1